MRVQNPNKNEALRASFFRRSLKEGEALMNQAL